MEWGFAGGKQNLSDWIKLQGIKHCCDLKLGASKQLQRNDNNKRQLIWEQEERQIKTHTWKWLYLKIGLWHAPRLIKQNLRAKAIIFITRYREIAKKHEPVDWRRCIGPGKRGRNETYYRSVGRAWTWWGNACLWSAGWGLECGQEGWSASSLRNTKNKQYPTFSCDCFSFANRCRKAWIKITRASIFSCSCLIIYQPILPCPCHIISRPLFCYSYRITSHRIVYSIGFPDYNLVIKVPVIAGKAVKSPNNNRVIRIVNNRTKKGARTICTRCKGFRTRYKGVISSCSWDNHRYKQAECGEHPQTVTWSGLRLDRTDSKCIRSWDLAHLRGPG